MIKIPFKKEVACLCFYQIDGRLKIINKVTDVSDRKKDKESIPYLAQSFRINFETLKYILIHSLPQCILNFKAGVRVCICLALFVLAYPH